MKRNHAVVAAVILCVVSLATSPKHLDGQVTLPSHDLNALERTFSNYSKDFRALEGPLHGDELQEVEFLDDVAGTTEDRLHAANAMLEMYDNVSCKPDREKVRPILRDQLGYYSWQMENEANRSAGSLQFAKMPVIAQMGLKMKDDLRTAKTKLDEIAASLN